MKGVPYYEAGKGDTPRSCNSRSYLDNYDQIKWANRPEGKVQSPRCKRGKSPRSRSEAKATMGKVERHEVPD